jgi:DNA-binding winged helix-turn-helix (wHTH) protein/Tol biopolymer transport system component
VDPNLPKSSAPRDPFRVGDFEVLPASNELRGRRGLQRLRPLLMQVLLKLAERPGEVVRRETLLEEVWPRRMVNDEVLSRAIAELRTALGDDAHDARYVETLPKVGYRLIARVEPIEPAVAPATTTPSTPAARAPRRVRHAALIAALAPGIAATALVVAIVAFWPRGAPPAASLVERLGEARPLTSDPDLEVSPRFSPDATRIAYALGRGTHARIVVQSLAGTERRLLGDPTGLALAPVFMPGGRAIAYWTQEGAGCAIVERALDGDTTRRWLDCARSPDPHFDVSREGRMVVSAVPRPQWPNGLMLVEAPGAEPRVLTSPEPGAGDDAMPRFSPDGQRIAFFRGNESHLKLWIMEVDRPESAHPVTRVDGPGYGVAWLGNDGPLLVAADWFGFRALNVVELASGEARWAGARGARFPDVSSTGDIVWENALFSANLWLVDEGREPKALWRTTRYTSQPEFAPDGLRAAFASNRDGADAIYVSALDGEPRRVAFDEGARFMRPHWSADGKSVLAVRLSVRDTVPVQEAVRIDAASGSLQVLGELGVQVVDARESPDGQSLVWAKRAGNAMRLLRASLGQPARAERLPLPLVSQYQLDADALYYLQPQLTALVRCAWPALACEPLPIHIADEDLYQWAPGPGAVYFRTRENGAPRLVRYDLETQRVEPVPAFVPGGAGTSIAASRDGRRLLLVREEPPAIDLMIARGRIVVSP